jgi:hypothetical protein
MRSESVNDVPVVYRAEHEHPVRGAYYLQKCAGWRFDTASKYAEAPEVLPAFIGEDRSLSL